MPLFLAQFLWKYVHDFSPLEHVPSFHEHSDMKVYVATKIQLNWEDEIKCFPLFMWQVNLHINCLWIADCCCLNTESCVCLCAKLLQSCATLWTVACQAPLTMGFSRQEYWGGLPHPPPGDLPEPGIEFVSFTSPASADRFFTASTTWEVPGHNLLDYI